MCRFIVVFLSQVAISRFDLDEYLPYEKLASNLKVVKDRSVASCVVLLPY